MWLFWLVGEGACRRDAPWDARGSPTAQPRLRVVAPRQRERTRRVDLCLGARGTPRVHAFARYGRGTHARAAFPACTLSIAVGEPKESFALFPPVMTDCFILETRPASKGQTFVSSLCLGTDCLDCLVAIV